MKDFFNYTKGYTKRKIYRFILFGILVFVLYILNACNVFADTTSETWLYQKCANSGNLYSCYDFSSQTYDTTQKLLSFNQDLLLKSIQVDYTFTSNQSITSTWKYLYFRIPMRPPTSQTTSETRYNFTDGVYENLFMNYYNIVPINCEYASTSTGDFTTCNVNFLTYSNNNGGITDIYLYLSFGSYTGNVKRVKLTFGSTNNFIGSGTNVYVNSIPHNIPNFAPSYTIYDSSDFSSLNKLTKNDSSLFKSGYLAYFIKGYQYSSFRNWSRSWTTDRDSSIPSSSQWVNVSYNNYVSLTPEQQQELQELENKLNYDNALINQQIGDTNYNEVNSSLSNSFNDTYNAFNTGVGSNFGSLMSSLFQYPLYKINSIVDEDIYTSQNDINLALCTGRDVIGNIGNRKQITLYHNSNINKTFSFNLPCPHYDIYRNIPGFYTANYVGTPFFYIYRVVLRGILVYLLFVVCLNVYKYVVDVNDTKVEVLEL